MTSCESGNLSILVLLHHLHLHLYALVLYLHIEKFILLLSDCLMQLTLFLIALSVLLLSVTQLVLENSHTFSHFFHFKYVSLHFCLVPG